METQLILNYCFCFYIFRDVCVRAMCTAVLLRFHSARILNGQRRAWCAAAGARIYLAKAIPTRLLATSKTV